VDIEGAFDNTSFASICQALEQRGAHPVVGNHVVQPFGFCGAQRKHIRGVGRQGMSPRGRSLAHSLVPSC